ncbi:preprotein translocase subunit SecE [Asanoa sp. WMMD1127]|uniref:preprotein translocase subunit SecE n=1 Tax=Asanoa sp. WMMD1127 TaxID=3016107 RepID=UPI0024175F5B|nr:preprotein translocase subunit SecE [Asanoa sp. WMMD1127]MDG4821232.1 preprotein translocase subunit SecE [Asanoa sp. WMMD1127]
MAEKNRRDDEFADDRLDDEAFDDAVDDDATDEDEPVSRGGTATRSRVAKAGEKSETKRTETGRVGFFGRIARFFREVVAELRKVIWPTRKELLTYTAVVVVFVAFMLAIVGLLDLGFAKGVLAVFGN